MPAALRSRRRAVGAITGKQGAYLIDSV